MPWQVLALISVTFASVSNIINRLLMKDDESDPVGYGIIFQFGLFSFSLILTLIFGKLQLPNGNEILLRFLISTILWTLFTVFSFSAMKNHGHSPWFLQNRSSFA